MANGKFLVGKPAGGVTTVTVADGATNTNLVLPESGTVSGVTTVVTDNAIARYDGVTGKLQNSGVTIDDDDYLRLQTGGIRLGSATGVGLLGVEVKSNSNIQIASIGRINTAATDSASLSFYADPVANTVTLDASGFNSSNLVIKNGSIENARFDTAGNLLLTSGTGALGYGTGAGGTVTQLTSKSTSVTLNKPSGRITTHNAALAAGASVFFVVNNSLVTTSDHIVLTMGGSTPNTNYTVFPTFSTGNGTFYVLVKNISTGSLSEALVINFSVIKGATA